MNAWDYCYPSIKKCEEFQEKLKSEELTKEEKLRLYRECEYSAQKAIRGFKNEHPGGAGANLFRFIVYNAPSEPEKFKPWLFLAHILVKEIPKSREQMNSWYQEMTGTYKDFATNDPYIEML